MEYEMRLDRFRFAATVHVVLRNAPDVQLRYGTIMMRPVKAVVTYECTDTRTLAMWRMDEVLFLGNNVKKDNTTGVVGHKVRVSAYELHVGGRTANAHLPLDKLSMGEKMAMDLGYRFRPRGQAPLMDVGMWDWHAADVKV